MILKRNISQTSDQKIPGGVAFEVGQECQHLCKTEEVATVDDERKRDGKICSSKEKKNNSMILVANIY